MTSVYIINCSLNPHSRGRKVYETILAQNPDFKGVDLDDYEMPLCNGFEQSAYAHPDVKKLYDLLMPVRSMVFITPIYNWDVNAVAKNFIELLGTRYKNEMTGKVFHKKVIGLIATASSKSSYLAPLGFLNSLMVDFESFMSPKYTVLSKDDFKEDGSFDMKRVDQTLDNVRLLDKALSPVLAQAL